MKKIITLAATVSLLFSSVSFASVSQDETAFLFATSNIQVQEISINEMATTEGQLFGLSMESTTKYLGLAFTALKPFAGKAMTSLKNKLVSSIQLRFNGLSPSDSARVSKIAGYGVQVFNNVDASAGFGLSQFQN